MKDAPQTEETFRNIVAPKWAIDKFKEYAVDSGKAKKKIMAEYVEAYLKSAQEADKTAKRALYGISSSAQMGVWIPNSLDEKVVSYAEELDCRVNRLYGTALIKGLIQSNRVKVHI